MVQGLSRFGRGTRDAADEGDLPGLIEGVEEGSPRVVIQGRPDGDQDW